VRNRDEISAERAIVLVHQQPQSKLYEIDLADEGGALRLGISHSEDTPATGEEEERDVIHIYRGLEAPSPPPAVPSTLDAPSQPTVPPPSLTSPPPPPLSSFFTRESIRRMGDDYVNVVRKAGLENAWHEQSWRGHTNDPNRHEHRSTEFGWSTMPGGSPKQLKGMAEHEPFRLSAWEHPKGKAFYEEHLEPLLPAAWKALVERFPRMAERMLAAVPERHRLCGTGFTKVTIAINNPTPLHFDDNNFGITFLVAFDLDGDLQGGHHLIVGQDFASAVLVRDNTAGTVFLGDYRRVLHSNGATVAGRRLIVTCYCSNSLVKRVGAHDRGNAWSNVCSWKSEKPCSRFAGCFIDTPVRRSGNFSQSVYRYSSTCAST
jgi:hypothetical protein